MTKKGQPYPKVKKSKKITNLKLEEPESFKVITVSRYEQDGKNKIEILGSTKRFSNENNARKFGEKVNEINANQSNHPKDTKVDIIVATDRIDALNQVKGLRKKIMDHEPNSIKLFTTDGKSVKSSNFAGDT
jgi:retron-type reverse transcriptase